MLRFGRGSRSGTGRENHFTTVPGRIDSTITSEIRISTLGRVDACLRPGPSHLSSPAHPVEFNVSNKGRGPEAITSIVAGDTCASNWPGRPTTSTISPESVRLLSMGDMPAWMSTVCSPTTETPVGRFRSSRVEMSSLAFCKSSGWVSTTPGRAFTICGVSREHSDNRRKYSDV